PDAPDIIFKALWGADPALRAQAAKLIRAKRTDAPLTDMTLAEIQSRMIHGATTHYQSNFDLDMLLQSLSEPITEDTLSPSEYIAKHEPAFLNAVSLVALSNDTAAQTLMLSDLSAESAMTRINPDDPALRPILAKAALAITPQLDAWCTRSQNAKHTRLSLRVLALPNSPAALNTIQTLAKNTSDISLRIAAIDALAALHSDESRNALKAFASDSNYLIRASAISHLDPSRQDEKQILQNALNDDFAIVSKTAADRLPHN
ncbi:MAG: HEAT repeat domain-containing protein, partial [Proteobacteria bacterium]|nr:HEAT repeat domain-containing protein [Pseudomonadota bacterium]